jgi:hypothetical protein
MDRCYPISHAGVIHQQACPTAQSNGAPGRIPTLVFENPLALLRAELERAQINLRPARAPLFVVIGGGSLGDTPIVDGGRAKLQVEVALSRVHEERVGQQVLGSNDLPGSGGSERQVVVDGEIVQNSVRAEDLPGGVP